MPASEIHEIRLITVFSLRENRYLSDMYVEGRKLILEQVLDIFNIVEGIVEEELQLWNYS